jgi:hypothetical protein
MIVGDVEGVRPRQPGAAAGQVVLARDRSQRARFGRLAIKSVVGEAEWST